MSVHTPPLPTIAAVELLLLTVGLKAVISRDVEKVGLGKLKDMAKVPKEIQDLAHKLVRDQLTASTDLPDFNYKAAVKELARGWDVKQVQEMVARFPAPYQTVGQALVVKAQDLIGRLLRLYPVTQYQTITGSINLLPSDTKLFHFVTLLEVLDEPLSVFQLMSTAALLKDQAAIVRQSYPTLSNAIDQAITYAVMQEKADKKSFELPPKAEVGVKAWFGKGPIPTNNLIGAQASHAMANSRPPKGPVPKGTDLTTKTQKTEATT